MKTFLIFDPDTRVGIDCRFLIGEGRGFDTNCTNFTNWLQGIQGRCGKRPYHAMGGVPRCPGLSRVIQFLISKSGLRNAEAASDGFMRRLCVAETTVSAGTPTEDRRGKLWVGRRNPHDKTQ
jgi:hypothetical protein